MISQRVTQHTIASRALTGLQGNLSRMGKLQEQLTSGKQIQRPSDSPAGTASALSIRSDLRSTQQYVRNADNGLGWLTAADVALTSGLDQTRRVRDLTLQGMSSVTAGSVQAREALAAEVDQIRESLINLANTRHADRPVFGGTTAGGAAYSAAGIYTGETESVQRTVADGVRVRVDTDGPATFGTGNTQLFAVLADIAQALRTDPAALGDGLARLDTAMQTLQTQLSDVGARYNRLAQMRQTAEDKLLTLRTQLSDVEDIDLPETIMQLQLQETAYQAALGATARAVQPSLMDFLR
jgi:flagellar hook-associated protein 3 FlgL